MISARTKGHIEHFSTSGGCSTAAHVVRSESDSSSVAPKTVFVMIPGNPGVVEYYSDFANALFNAVKRSDSAANFDVISLSHPGHSFLDHGDSEVLSSWNKYFGTFPADNPLNLRQQMDHKICLFDHIVSLYPAETRFILAGHSIGSYMALEVLKARSDRISQVVLLFPTITEIAASKKGQIVSKITLPGVRHTVSAILFALRPFLAFFPVVLYGLVALFTGMTGDPLTVTVERLLHHNSGLHALTLGAWEMKQVLDLDAETISNNLDKLVLYYGPEDGWADETYYRQIKERFPGIKALLCEDGVTHDFVVGYSEIMARKVAQWLMR
ncbi:hypothetical protein HDU77_000839 [Chytriomyces hyalinus]|nr:hypothetical protein HDU77_000839 [Chytriomyces hyalinus]